MLKNQRIYLGFFFATFGILCSTVCRAQNSSSQDVNASAAIFAPLRLLKISDLNFGGIIQGPNGGDVIMSEQGIRSFPTDPLGPSVYYGSGSTTKMGSTAASFIVTGEASNSYSITTPESMVVSDGTHAMTIKLGKPIGPNVDPDGTTARLSPEGTDAWKIGGTLSVGAGQPSGYYTGSFTELITYE